MTAAGRSVSRMPGQGAYARPEIERRFRVSGPVPASADVREISDLYLDGLRLRLRRVAAAGTTVFKLTQKVRPVADDPAEVSLTTMYLDEAEYERLRELPGRVLTKTRTLVDVAGEEADRTWAVDAFHGSLHGLVLAEVELPEHDVDLALPAWLGAEVTHDDRFSGGRLAGASAAEVSVLLAAEPTHGVRDEA